jgi:hypothetical protein
MWEPRRLTTLSDCVRQITDVFPSWRLLTELIPTNLITIKWNRSVGIGQATVWKTGVRFQAEAIFPISAASRPVLRPIQPPIQWVPGVLSLGVKQQQREADNLPPSSAQFKNGGAIPPLPKSWRSVQIITHRGKFTQFHCCLPVQSSVCLVYPPNFC